MQANVGSVTLSSDKTLEMHIVFRDAPTELANAALAANAFVPDGPAVAGLLRLMADELERQK